MRITCPHCKSQYNLQDGRVSPAGANIKCPRCKKTFLVRSSAAAESPATRAPPNDSVPLPEPASAPGVSSREKPIPLPAAPATEPAPTAPPAAAVPLPPPPFGTKKAAAPTASAVPLPPPVLTQPAGPGAKRVTGEPPPLAVAMDAPPLSTASDQAPAPSQSAPEPLGFGEVVLDDEGEGRETTGSAPLNDDGFGVPLPEDPFTTPAPAPAVPDPVDESPHEVVSPIEMDDLEVLLDDDHHAPKEDAQDPFAAPSEPAENVPGYRVRRPSGKVFGPFPEQGILAMLRRGELHGNEEICSAPGDKWMAMGRVPAFASAIRGISEPELLDDEVQDVPSAGSAPQIAPRVETGRSKGNRRLVLAALAVILLIAGVGAGAGFTRYGWFFTTLFRKTPAVSPKAPLSGANAAARAFPASGDRARLAEDRLDAIQSALASAEQALARDPKDVSAAETYCLAAAWLHIHDVGGSAMSRAEKLAQDLAARAPEDPATIRAQISLALAGGSAGTLAGPHAKLERQVKDAKEPDEEAMALLGDLTLERKDLARASLWYQKLESLRPNARSSHKLGLLALAQGDVPSARRSFEQALTRDPTHQSSAVELAALLDGSNETPNAESLLEAAIAADGPGRLPPRDRAKARALLAARIARARAGDATAVPELEKELQAALKEDPAYLPARLQLARILLRSGGAERAATLLSSTPGEASDSVEVIALRARALSASGRLLDAITLIDQGLAKSPGAPPLLFAKGEVLEQGAKWQEALKLYQDAAERDPTLWEARVALGRAALRDGDLARAEKALLLALEKAPGEAEVHARLGDLEVARKNLEKAEQYYRKALSLDAGSVRAQLGLARVLLARGDKAGGQAALDRVLTLDPRLTEGHLMLGALLLEKRDLPGAQKAFEAAVAADPRSASAFSLLGQVRLEQGQIESAVEALQQSVDLDLTVAESHHWLGRALWSKGDKTRALDQLTRAAQLAPDNAVYQMYVGIAREGQNALQDALEAYRLAIAKDPKLVEAHERIGVLFGAQNHCKEALPFLEKALELAPTLQRLRVELGDCKARLGKHAEAIQLYRQAQKGDPRSSGIDYKIARSLHESSGIGSAIPLYEKAAREDSTNAMPHYYLGYAYKERGQKARAIQEFRAYLKVKPTAEDRKDIEQEIEYLGGAR